MKRGLSDMWFPMTLRAGRPRIVVRCGQGLLATLGLLLSLLLSGCGGGGGGINSTSSSDQGFRIVPAGGNVVPLSDSSGTVTLVTSPNAVSTGVQVSAASVTAPTTPLPVLSNGTTVPVPGGAFQISFSPDSQQPVFPVVLSLSYSSAPAGFVPASSFHIYYYDGKQWTVLPFTVVATSTTPATVTATMETVGTDTQGKVSLTPYLKTGLYAIFATAPPAMPTL